MLPCNYDYMLPVHGTMTGDYQTHVHVQSAEHMHGPRIACSMQHAEENGHKGCPATLIFIPIVHADLYSQSLP